MSRVDVKAAYAKLNTAEKMAISVLHALLHDIKNDPERFVDEGTNPVRLIEDIEFALQGLWKFPRNANYHTHWKWIEGCTCPKMDNDDPCYFGRGKIIAGACQWHGKK